MVFTDGHGAAALAEDLSQSCSSKDLGRDAEHRSGAQRGGVFVSGAAVVSGKGCLCLDSSVQMSSSSEQTEAFFLAVVLETLKGRVWRKMMEGSHAPY